MEMHKIIESLKTKMSFKEHTSSGDIILVGSPNGFFYGMVKDIEPDSKKNWYQFHFTLFSLPPVSVSWILRVPQFTGEIFSMNEEDHFVIAVDLNVPDKDSPQTKDPKKTSKKQGLRLVKND